MGKEIDKWEPKDIADISNRLKDIREELGMTQNEFSEEIGVPYSTYVKIERGEMAINLDVVRGIHGLKVPSDFVLFGKQYDDEDIISVIKNTTIEFKLQLFLTLYQDILNYKKMGKEMKSEQISDLINKLFNGENNSEKHTDS
ncbi:MAG: helix-turn-helix transcriptional regulator [Lachnospiraceae bacterium]|nr:helix-turn-helix transcriptional regulator [Lachnospiraceae bacterium]